MSTPSRFKKDKEIIAEYESQVKGKRGAREAPPRPQGRGAPAERAPVAGRPPAPPAPSPGLRAAAGSTATAVRAVGPCCPNFGAAAEGSGEGAAGGGCRFFPAL